MIRRTPGARAGITLTEILISILILGIGIVSLATLFPLGLLRLREAARMSRSGYLTESAAADLGSRDLLNKTSFLNPFLSNSFGNPWYVTQPSGGYDPWIQDTPGYFVDWGPPTNVFAGTTPVGANRPIGPGLPVAYDPLWRFLTGVYADNTSANNAEARFASGVGFVRNDPNPVGGISTPSAWGLQRITNFNPTLTANRTIPDIFVSPEDLVLQGEDGSTGPAGASPIVPILSTDPTSGAVSYTNEWRYTWMFTGQQSDVSDGTVFNGDIVVFENRPFSYDFVPGTQAGYPSVGMAAGETVVEAVFGYGTSLNPSNGTGGYAAAANRVVLLRWPAAMPNGSPVPDPDVRVGSWIADVTYERIAAVDNARVLDGTAGVVVLPYQRCYWYQIVKRTQPGISPVFNGDGGQAYRSMTVWVSTDLRAQTLMDVANAGSPYHVNAALISPYVVNVFPRTVYTR